MARPTGNVLVESTNEVLGQVDDYERFFVLQIQVRPNGPWRDLNLSRGGLARALPERYRVAYEAFVRPKAKFANRSDMGFDDRDDAQTTLSVLVRAGLPYPLRLVRRTISIVTEDTVL